MPLAATPVNFYVTTANQQVFLQWDLQAGATGYSVNRSTDGGLTYTVVASPLTNSYLDTSVTIGNQYLYQVASTNISGTSPYTPPQQAVPTVTGEMCLSQIRLAAQQRADRVNSNFVTLPEWNSYINQAMFELYDLLVTSYNDYFMAPYASFTMNGSSVSHPLPDGTTAFIDSNGNSFVPQPFYKMLGVDLALNTANNAYVSVPKFVWADRNKFVYPNTASTIYGVFNLRYRVMGSNIEFIPTPSGNQTIRLSYIPRLRQLLQETDTTTDGISGWIEYVIVRAAIYALAKEESDTSDLKEQLLFVKQRIEESAANRDAGQPDTISDIRSVNGFGQGFGWNGATGGY